jgi:hypothetical protein
MPPYFFHTRNDTSHIDLDGSDLTDLDAAWDDAETLRDIRGAFGGEWTMEVTDASGDPVFTLRFSATRHVREYPSSS